MVDTKSLFREGLILMQLMISLFLVLALSSHAGAEVIVDDSIALTDSAHMLTVRTMGRFFPMGGEVVEFFVDDISIGKNLSGGDGRAFKEFAPGHRGLNRISAVSGKERGSGLLLVLDKGEGIVFIDIEGSLSGGVFPMKPGKGSQDSIKSISERFPVIYLKSTMLDAGFLKGWLKKYDFEDAPVLEWRGGDVFKEVTGYGLKVRAVIGVPPVIESAEGYTSALFSFDGVDGAEDISGWDQLDEKIR